jgi:subtilisin family serine protease
VKIHLKKCLLSAFIAASIITGLFAGWQLSVTNDAVSASNSREFSETGKPALSPDSSPRPASLNTQSDTYSQILSGVKARWTQDRIIDFSLSPNVNCKFPVIVAVLDTGIDKNHELLIGKVEAEIDLSNSASADDIYGHGTSIAGIIAAGAYNGLGVSGVAPNCRLLNVKVADDEGKCSISSLAQGIIWAADHSAKVINISLELKGCPSDLQKAIDYAWEKGAVIIAAAGNDGNSLPVYPACCNNCIAVTAIKENGSLAPLANFGEWVDVAAPGYKIYTSLPNNNYGYKYGTSYAAAYISGLAAVLFSSVIDTNANGAVNDEVRQAIETGYNASATYIPVKF